MIPKKSILLKKEKSQGERKYPFSSSPKTLLRSNVSSTYIWVSVKSNYALRSYELSVSLSPYLPIPLGKRVANSDGPGLQQFGYGKMSFVWWWLINRT